MANQSQKIVLYRTQKIINALLCKSLPKLMFSKLKYLITFVIFWVFLLNIEDCLTLIKTVCNKEHTGNILIKKTDAYRVTSVEII